MNQPDPTSKEPPAAPTAPATALPPKRLYRDPRGPIGGVAGGFAGYFDIDPVIARLLWVVALLSGIGLPAYLLCWLVVPKAQSWPPAGYHGRPASNGGELNNTGWISGLLIVALAALIGRGVDGLGDYLLPAALVGFGVYLLNQRVLGTAEPKGREPSRSGEEPAPLEPARPEGDAAAQPGGAGSSGSGGLVTGAVLSLLALGAGILLALAAADVAHVSLTGAAAAGLVIVGGGLLASLWLGRARGLLPVGIGLVLILLAASTRERWGAEERDREQQAPAQGALASGTVGERQHLPRSLQELQSHYELGVGRLELDLSQLDFTGHERAVRLNVGIGEALVIVPSDTAVEVRGGVGLGEARVLGREASGMQPSLQQEDPGEGAGKLEIEFNVGIGKGQVRRGH